MRVLLVDDHALFREGVAMLLQPMQESMEILEADSCEEAFEVLSRSGPVDLVLIDLAMPGGSGLDGLRRLREEYPGMPAVALSSSDDLSTVLGALDAGAMGFVPKSSTSAILIGALRLILAHGIYLPPSAFLAGRAPEVRPAAPGTDPAMPADPPSTCRPADLGLTPRQADVLRQILQGKSAKLIGRDLNLSESTVKQHTGSVLRALNVTTRTQAVLAAARLGLRLDAD
jgi:DNA-binding NarL/FixJ family response regulator